MISRNYISSFGSAVLLSVCLNLFVKRVCQDNLPVNFTITQVLRDFDDGYDRKRLHLKFVTQFCQCILSALPSFHSVDGYNKTDDIHVGRRFQYRYRFANRSSGRGNVFNDQDSFVG